jgi:hypothetical protein
MKTTSILNLLQKHVKRDAIPQFTFSVLSIILLALYSNSTEGKELTNTSHSL